MPKIAFIGAGNMAKAIIGGLLAENVSAREITACGPRVETLNKPGQYSDGDNLYLVVKPSGAKSWVLRVQVAGRRRDYGLGSLDVVSLQEARETAQQDRKLAKGGLDPSIERKKAQRSVPSFEKAARSYHEAVKPSWRERWA